MTTEQSETILVLEDDILVRNPLAEYLRGCGYRVIEASNPAEAQQIFEASEVRVHVLFASASGEAEVEFDLARWARTRHQELNVILAGSMRAATQKAGDLCEEGPAFTRPYNHQHLLDRIRRLTAARQRNVSTRLSAQRPAAAG
jgi:DNA-binding response OmpR family regulator